MSIQTYSEQKSLELLYTQRDIMIRGALTAGTHTQILRKERSDQGPFTVQDFHNIGELQNELKRNYANIIKVLFSLYYKQELGAPILSEQGNANKVQHAYGCIERTSQRVDDFFVQFRQGLVDLSALPEPEKPRYQLIEGDVIKGFLSEKDQKIARVELLLTEKKNLRVQRNIELDNLKLLNCLKFQDQWYSDLSGIGGLHAQMQFLHFIGNKYQWEKPALILRAEEVGMLRAEFAALDAAFDPEPAASRPTAQKKKKKGKQKKQKAPVIESTAPVTSPPKAVVSSQVKKYAALNVRLNAFHTPHGCTLDKRVLRWGTANLNQIREFIDYNIEGNPQKPYEHETEEALKKHKENHDIPIHTVLREQTLIADYSNLNTHYSPKNGKQFGRQFYAEKTTRTPEGALHTETGLILTSKDKKNVVFHCQFVPTTHIKPQYFEEQARAPQGAEDHVGLEEKDDGNTPAAPFQFEGKYHIEIDPATQDIIIKIGQDIDPSQVIYRIKHLHTRRS